MNLKLVNDDESALEDVTPCVGVSKMKNKCVLVSNLNSSLKKQASDKFWIKNQAERKEIFKEYLSELLV